MMKYEIRMTKRREKEKKPRMYIQGSALSQTTPRKTMNEKLLPLIVTGITLAGSARLMAQAAPDAAPVAASARAGSGALTTQYLMQNNGGSLLQASQPQPQASASGEPASKTPAYDFYAVNPPEPHVLKKHDLVNIVVNEESKSQTSGLSDQERASDFDAKVDAFVKFNLAKLSLQGGAEGANPPEVKLEGTRDFKGTGEYDRSDTMTIRLEAEVIDVKPNGTLVIQARRHLKVDEEEISVSLTGNCRVQDVDAANSVLSTDLHDLDLTKSTKGEVRDTERRGLIHRLLDIVSPF
jgi:flagellar L-ring protein precursor FlgH